MNTGFLLFLTLVPTFFTNLSVFQYIATVLVAITYF